MLVTMIMKKKKKKIEMDLEIDAPWGKVDSTQPVREHVRHFIKQLKYMLRNNRSSNVPLTKIDLKGYKVLLEADDDTIEKFLEMKTKARDAGRPIANNIQLVNHMKTSGLWKRRG